MLIIRTTVLLLSIIIADASYSEPNNLPGSVDPSRVITDQNLEKQQELLDNPDNLAPIPEPNRTPDDTPEKAKEITFTLKKVTINGVKAYDKAHFKNLYAKQLNKKVTAEFIWKLAEQISNQYLKDGYFLSFAYVPEQKITSGNIVINVIEGYVSKVDLTGIKQNYITKKFIDDILLIKPLNVHALESILLRLNDIHGLAFESILSKDQDIDGAAILNLSAKKDGKLSFSISTNNHGSRFSGPQRTGASLLNTHLPYHKTFLYGQVATPEIKELGLAYINHKARISPDSDLDFVISQTRLRPGHTLKNSNIVAYSTSIGSGLEWKLLRQRIKNLALSAKFDLLNSKTLNLGTVLSKDYVRIGRIAINYDHEHAKYGANNLGLTFARGLKVFNGSGSADDNLSNADAKPSFNKINLSYSNNKYLSDKFLINTQLSMQWSSIPLFSSEKIGFGGASVGKAYDSSEITGDRGVTFSIETNYLGAKDINNYKITPFAFYDIGKIFNSGANADIRNRSASSIGLGLRGFADYGISIDSTIALPIGKPINTPLYNRGNKSLSLRFSITYFGNKS